MSRNFPILWIKTFVLIFLAIATPQLLIAGEKQRSGRPFQLSVDIDGGGTFGIHLSPTWYLGYIKVHGNTYEPTVSPQQNASNTTSNSEIISDYYGYTGGSKSNKNGNKEGPEIRFYPFDVGIFIGAASLKRGIEEEQITYKNQTRVLGSNTYNTGFNAKLEFEEQSYLATSLGWNGISEGGLTFTICVYFGFEKRPTPTVTLSGWSTTVSAADEQIVHDEISYQAAQMNETSGLLQIGFTF